ncbi:MAG: Cas10/Cmr2 second palm domain-containing protein [Thermacetogeniaceae bacterium]
MIFIDWLKDICDPLGVPSETDHPPGDSICWMHPVTGSCYYLEKRKAREITLAGLAWAKALIREKEADVAANLLSDFLFQRDAFRRAMYLEKKGFQFADEKDFIKTESGGMLPLVALWPELPYPGRRVTNSGEQNKATWLRGKNKQCVRLADFLLLRTGLFYAMASEKMLQEEWAKIRLTSLLEGSWVFADEGLDLDGVPEHLCRIYEAATLLAGYPDELALEERSAVFSELPSFELVVGGAFKVKDYYLETNRIGEIRGASILLDDINRKRYVTMFRELPKMTLESLIFAGGGHMMAAVPAGMGKTVAGEIERLHREVCLTARAVGEFCSTNPAEMVDFKGLRNRLEEKMWSRRGVLVPTWDRVEGIFELYGDGTLRIDDSFLPAAGDGEWCGSCGIRLAVKVWKYDGEERPLCASCLRKQLVGQQASKAVFADDYREFWKVRGVSEELPVAQEIEEIADDNNEIGVIYADGNNFGSLFGNCDSFSRLRMLSQFSENAAYTGVFTALRENSKLLGGKAVEIIALGGDDIFLIVPAQAAFPLATAIGTYFDRLFRNLSEKKASPTLSLGVVIAGAKTPVRYFFEVAQKLLKEAKKKAYREGQLSENSGANEGTLDIAVLASYSAYEDDIASWRTETFRKEKPENLIFTLRPYTFKYAEKFMEAVRNLQASRNSPGKSWFYGIRQAAQVYGSQVAELFFNYQLSRLSDEQREVLSRSWRLLTGENSETAMFFKRGEGLCCPWIDVVELWNYVGGEGGSGEEG